MKAYKGFFKTRNGKLRCRNFVYEEGKTYTIPERELPIKLCARGFHACKEFYQVWAYYPNNGEVEYHEVECSGSIIDVEGERKICCSKITIGPKIDTSNLPLFEHAGYEVQDDYILVQGFDGKESFIDTNGKLIADGNCWYDYAWTFRGGFAKVQRRDGKESFIDTNGNLIGDGNCWYKNIWSFRYGFAMVQQSDEKWSFIDTNGNLIGDGNQWYKHAWSFCDGFARVQLYDGKWTFIGTDGKLIDNIK